MRRLLLITAILLSFVACDSEKEDPGPLVAAGWVDKCELGCDQISDCSPDQLIFDHGDLDNCKRTCGVDMETDVNAAFIESTPEECLTRIYEKAGCIFDLSCDDFSAWKVPDADNFPCMDAEQEAALSCDGIDTVDFEWDVGIPPRF